MITEIEQASLDIDWFITDGEYVGFMASGGGKLPESVARTKKNNEILTEFFISLPEISEVEISPNLDNILIKVFGSGIDERYLEYYVSMTKKGLFSFDKTYPNQFLDPYYHLVATPKKPLKLKDLPQNILDMVVNTQYNNSLINTQEINISEID